MFELLRPFLIALFIGLLIGIERERSQPEHTQAIGVRTFIFIALLGTFAATIAQTAIIVVTSIFVFSAILLGYWRSTRLNKKGIKIGLTTEFSAGVVYCLGFMTPKHPSLTVILVCVILLLLIERKHIHKFSREKLKPREIEAGVTIIIVALGVIPFMPNHTIDPWHLFNPLHFSLLVLLIAAIQFVGYVGMRIFGQQSGAIFMGFFGGLVSSTAVFTVLPGFAKKQPKMWPAVAVSAVYATNATLIELAAILFVASPSLGFSLLLPLLVMVFLGAISLFFIKLKKVSQIDYNKLMKPLDVKQVIKLALFIASLLLIVAVTKRYVGDDLVQLIAFLGGLFELQAVSLATALLYSEHALSLSIASTSIALAVLASFISKYFILVTMGRGSYRAVTVAYLSFMLLCGAIVFLLFGMN